MRKPLIHLAVSKVWSFLLALFSFSFSFLLLNIKILTKEVVVRRDLGNRDSSVNQAHVKRPLYKNSKVIYFIPFPLWAKLL